MRSSNWSCRRRSRPGRSRPTRMSPSAHCQDTVSAALPTTNSRTSALPTPTSTTPPSLSTTPSTATATSSRPPATTAVSPANNWWRNAYRRAGGRTATIQPMSTCSTAGARTRTTCLKDSTSDLFFSLHPPPPTRNRHTPKAATDYFCLQRPE
jgi:hypothetical protein